MSGASNAEQIGDRFRRFSEIELNHLPEESESEERFNWDGWRKCAAFGVHGLPVSPEFGGSGSGMSDVISALQGLGYGCLDNGLLFSINAHMWGCQLPVALFGSEELKRRYLPRLVSGEWVGGLAVSELEAGSDAFNLSTRARRDGDAYVLDGSKTFVTNGTLADVLVVLARVDGKEGMESLTALVVEKGFAGYTVERKIGKMGLLSAEMGALVFQGCRVPVHNRLGGEGLGATLFSQAMEWERACILASAVGTMERILEQTIEYAQNRVQFGAPISKQPVVAARIVDMKLRLENSKLLLRHVGELKDGGASVLMEASMAKLFVSEAWVRICSDAMKVFGGYGYLKEFAIERELRDALGSRFFSGTADIQRFTVSRLMGL